MIIKDDPTGVAFTESITTAATHNIATEFFVLARDRGTVRNDLPVWASRMDDPFQLAATTPNNGDCPVAFIKNDGEIGESADNDSKCLNLPFLPERREVDGVPGAFQIVSILSKEEANVMGMFAKGSKRTGDSVL
jgi:hypothetical protein